jgi:hypothetical protein
MERFIWQVSLCPRLFNLVLLVQLANIRIRTAVIERMFPAVPPHGCVHISSAQLYNYVELRHTIGAVGGAFGCGHTLHLAAEVSITATSDSGCSCGDLAGGGGGRRARAAALVLVRVQSRAGSPEHPT